MQKPYWINKVFADGTESDYRDSAYFRTESQARKAAAEYSADGVPQAFVIKDGTVIACYEKGQEVEF